jgi:hypothetical protein
MTRMRWEEHVVQDREMKHANYTLVCKPISRSCASRPNAKLENNMSFNMREKNCEAEKWLKQAMNKIDERS